MFGEERVPLSTNWAPQPGSVAWKASLPSVGSLVFAAVQDGCISSDNFQLADSNGFTDPADIQLAAVGDWWDLPASYDRAIKIRTDELAKRPTDHNNLGDALRHSEWSRRVTDEIGSGYAWTFGFGHEILDNTIKPLWNGGSAQPFNELLMDLNSNHEGIKAALEDRPVSIDNLRYSTDGIFQGSIYGINP